MAAQTTSAVKAPATIPFPAPATSGQYASDLDVVLGGNPTTDPTGQKVLSAWVQSESATFPGFNGLGTTLELPGSTPVPGNSANVQLYPTLREGLQAADDMMLGLSPQTTPLAPKFVADLRTGTETEAQLTSDVLASGWDGSGGDTYDATAIASKLGESNFSTAGAASSTAPTSASTTGLSLNPITDVTNALGGSLSGVMKQVGIYVLKGIITLTGAALFVYGAKLTTERGSSSSSSSSGGGGGILGPAASTPEEAGDLFPAAAELAPAAVLA